MSRPPATIPTSTSTVKVRMIDSTTRINNIRTSLLFSNPIPGFSEINDMPMWAFLIEHPDSGTRMLFDLGTRVDWVEKGPPAARDDIAADGYTMTVQSGIDQILLQNGLATTHIDGVIWSHMHWDHTGNMTLFPRETPLIVGPRFREEFFPGWPADEESTIDSAAWSDGRTLVELCNLDPGAEDARPLDLPDQPSIGHTSVLSFLKNAPTTTISGLPALDLFADGSFYILSTPGHTVAHLCALARTGPSSSPSSPSSSADGEFILLAADAFDNGGQIRPSPHMHLPEGLKEILSTHGPALLERTREHGSGNDTGKGSNDSIFSHPFLNPEAADAEMAEASLRGIMGLDAREDVLTICAHEKYHTFPWPGQGPATAVAAEDRTGAVGRSGLDGDELGFRFFPGYLNGWRDRKDASGRNLRDVLLWWFLKDYRVPGLESGWR